MINDYITHFRSLPGCITFEPAIEANLIKVEAELNSRSFAAVPEDYKTFLKLSDGLIFNGVELYGSIPHYRPNKEYTFPNLITANETYINYDYFTRKLVIGRISESILLYDSENHIFSVIDRINLRPRVEVNNFPDFLKIFYEHSLRLINKNK